MYLDKTVIQKDTQFKKMLTGALFTIAKRGRQPKRSWTDEWIKKMQYYIQWNTT